MRSNVRVRPAGEAGSTIAWSLFPSGTAAAVGVVGLHHIDRSAACAQVAYELDEEYSGRGLATEALQRVLEFASAEMGLRRIEAHIDPNNSRSVRLAVRKSRNRSEAAMGSLALLSFSRWSSFSGAGKVPEVAPNAR